MTRCFAVNENNDIYIGQDSNLAIVNGIEATEQACQHAAQAQLGEMVLAITQGMPTFQTIWNGTPNINQYEAVLRSTLLSVSGVNEVVSIVFNQTVDEISYTAVIRTIYGLGTVTGSIVNG